MESKSARAAQQEDRNAVTNEGLERQHPARYWELISAAAKLFQEKGYHSASVRDISNAVGITSGSFFYHFATKEDLLIAVLEGGMIEGLEVVRKSLNGASGARERLLALIRGHLQALHAKHSYAHKVWIREWQQVPTARRGPLEELSRTYRDIWLDVLQQAKREELIASDIGLFRKMAVGALNWTVHWVHEPTEQQLQDLAEAFTSAFLNEAQTSGATITGMHIKPER